MKIFLNGKNLGCALAESRNVKMWVVGCAWGVDGWGVFGGKMSWKSSLEKTDSLQRRCTVHLPRPELQNLVRCMSVPSLVSSLELRL